MLVIILRLYYICGFSSFKYLTAVFNQFKHDIYCFKFNIVVEALGISKAPFNVLSLFC